MKTLLIARHGKSSWVHDELKDIDRSLDASGIKGVYHVAQNLKEHSILPDVLISSPATRAIHTALIHARVLDFPSPKIEIHEGIYYGGEAGVLEILTKQQKDISCLMVCGHNPTSTNLVNRFATNDFENLQTSGVVKLEFDIENWQDITTTKSTNSIYYKRNGSIILK